MKESALYTLVSLGFLWLQQAKLVSKMQVVPDKNKLSSRVCKKVYFVEHNIICFSIVKLQKLMNGTFRKISMSFSNYFCSYNLIILENYFLVKTAKTH